MNVFKARMVRSNELFFWEAYQLDSSYIFNFNFF